MPKVKKGKTYSKSYSETDVQNALEEISNGLSTKTAAKKYNVPRATLQFRKSDKFSKTSHGPNPILADEEKVLVEWILDNFKKGFPRRKEDICAVVKEFLTENPRKNPFKNNYPGGGWYKAFLKRHPHLTQRTSEAVTQASANISERDIRNWFTQIYSYLEDNGLTHILEDPKRIYNGDETNFQLCPKNSKVIAPKGIKNVYEVDVGQAKQTITVMFTFGASGDITPPMIIYPFKRMPQHIVQSVPKHWGIGHSENGWMKAELFYEYISNVLYPHLKGCNITFPIILFVDGHSTHLTYKLSKLCKELQIILICLYANATRILQPADVSAFKPLKSGWKQGVLEWRRQNSTEALTKDKFAPVLEKVINKCIKPSTISNGFRSCGLYPWDMNAIDYTKCIGKNSDTNKNIQTPNTLTYGKFFEIVGAETIENFKKIDLIIRNYYSEDFIKLYKIWKEFGTYEEENKTDANTEIDNTLFDIENMPLTLVSQDGEIIFQTDITPLSKENEQCDDLNKEKQIIKEVPLEAVDSSAKCLFIEKSTLDNGTKMQEFLSWPESPQRKGKRISERMPYVLTSTEWQNIQEKKKLKKDEAEKLKEERKRKRMENKEIKKENTGTKSKAGTKKKNINIISNVLLKKEDQISTSQIGFLFPKSEKTTNRTIKIEVCDDKKPTAEETCIISTIKGCDKTGDEPKVKELDSFPLTNNKEAKVGNLCHKCTFQISNARKGLLCKTCIREYHYKCILDKINIERKTFICDSCK